MTVGAAGPCVRAGPVFDACEDGGAATEAVDKTSLAYLSTGTGTGPRGGAVGRAEKATIGGVGPLTDGTRLAAYGI
ncbi:hypothetical protein GCM10019016_030530 [Streptomyces prasinosporus]|uniref:Uncharacterized protein n=1 Tax=Streptomyces prasinosporus TaxID=68256 RepID=A0ABP6TL34_9ACTN